jgi:hypothetical protein
MPARREAKSALHKVFNKLNIGSRNQLDGALPREPGAPVSA